MSQNLSNNRVWLLGAADPEMAAIESLLRECGERVEYALDATDRRVHPSVAYSVCGRTQAHLEHVITHVAECGGPYVDGDCCAVCLCGLETPLVGGDICPQCGAERKPIVRFDHHRPGDRGFGRPPAEFFESSSIGQVIAELHKLGRLPESWQTDPTAPERSLGYYTEDGAVTARVPRRYVVAAAADHCLGHAYAVRCHGVSREDVLRYRAECADADPQHPTAASRDALLRLMAEAQVGLLVARREEACCVLAEEEGGPAVEARWAAADPNAFPRPITPSVQSWPTGKYGMWESPGVPDQWAPLFDAIDPIEAESILGGHNVKKV